MESVGVSEEVRLLEHMVLSEFPGKASYLDLRDDFHVRVLFFFFVTYTYNLHLTCYLSQVLFFIFT